MTKLLKTAVLASSIVFAGGMATSALAGGHTSAEKAINSAKAAYQQALEVGGAWRDTAKMIKQAEKLLKDGKAEQAAHLAEEAEAQSMLGHIQATTQSLQDLHI